MSALSGILPKLLVFGGSVLAGAVVASLAVGLVSSGGGGPIRGPNTSEPEYVLETVDTPSGPGPVAAFDDEPSESAAPEPVATLAPEELQEAALALLGGGPQEPTPAKFQDPTGFPRVQPITQFDGGPFAGANCTLASGSMLARLAFGIVTSGSTLRTLQDDQDGGTGLNDLATALWRGYGITVPSGMLRPDQLKNLLASGYGAVIQGVYGEIPTPIRLQKDFTGGHAIYVDGYYPGNPGRGIPEAYYVIDPLGRPHGGYQGDWWPASIVDKFALTFGGGRIAAMWAFPPGGVPPEVVGPDVLPIPPDPGGGPGPNPTATPVPSEPAESPSESPSASPSDGLPPASPGPVGPGPIITGFEPGDITVFLPEEEDPPVGGGFLGGIDLFPVFDICLIKPTLAGCPSGIPARFPAGQIPIVQFQLAPAITVTFVDSDRANEVLVGFTVDPPKGPADVKYWVRGLSPAAVQHASAMSSLTVLGTTMTVARLEVTAATTYDFQVVAGDGLFAGTSEVGSFTTGSGVEAFDVALSTVASPVFKAGVGVSPYSKQAPQSFLFPMVRLTDIGGSACELRATFGATGYCLDQADFGAASDTCTSADVTYDLAGIPGDTVYVRAFPTEAGELPDGGLTLDGVLEATGPNGSTTVRVGCLGAGMAYTITIDVVGDDRGVLAAKVVDVP